MKRSASPSLGDLGVKSECKAEDMEQTPPVEKKRMPDLNSNGRNLVIRLLIPSDVRWLFFTLLSFFLLLRLCCYLFHELVDFRQLDI